MNKKNIILKFVYILDAKMNVDTNYIFHYERITFIKRFDEITKPYTILNNYKSISVYNMEILNKRKVIQGFDKEMDNIFFEAIRYYFNLNCVIFFNIQLEEAYLKFKKHFVNDFTLYGIKVLKLNFNKFKNIFYQLKNQEFDSLTDMEQQISKLYPHTKDNVYPISILILKYNKDEFCEFESYKRGEIYYIPRNICEKITLIGAIFNSTSLRFYEKQDINSFIEKKFTNGFKFFHIYREWLYRTVDPRDLHKCMLFSSIVLYLLGLRDSNDLDLYISNLTNSFTSNIEHSVNSSFILENKRYKNIDASIEGTFKWKHYWKNWLDSWANKVGAISFKEILINPKYHFYFMGVKTISIDCDIIRRVLRNRPRSTADLIMLNKRYDFKIQIPMIADTIVEYTQLRDLTETELKIKLRNGGILDMDLNEVKIEMRNDKEKFLKTLNWILKIRFGEIISVERIKEIINNSNVISKKTITLKIKKK